MRDDRYCDTCGPYPCNCYPAPPPQEPEDWRMGLEDLIMEGQRYMLRFPTCYRHQPQPSMALWGGLSLPGPWAKDDINF